MFVCEKQSKAKTRCMCKPALHPLLCLLLADTRMPGARARLQDMHRTGVATVARDPTHESNTRSTMSHETPQHKAMSLPANPLQESVHRRKTGAHDNTCCQPSVSQAETLSEQLPWPQQQDTCTCSCLISLAAVVKCCSRKGKNIDSYSLTHSQQQKMACV